jgi:hypothetical protein
MVPVSDRIIEDLLLIDHRRTDEPDDGSHHHDCSLDVTYQPLNIAHQALFGKVLGESLSSWSPGRSRALPESRAVI